MDGTKDITGVPWEVTGDMFRQLLAGESYI